MPNKIKAIDRDTIITIAYPLRFQMHGASGLTENRMFIRSTALFAPSASPVYEDKCPFDIQKGKSIYLG
jgi:hypothetical protein